MNNKNVGSRRGLGRGGGRGMGQGSGQGLGRGGGRGQNSGGGYSIGGYCVCAKCGARTAHQQGIPCTNQKCPTCGTTMIREELLNARRGNK